MAVISSNTQIQSAEFKQNFEQYSKLLQHFKDLQRQAIERESKAIERQRSRDKLLVNERIEALVDPGAPILHLSSLAGLNCYEGVPPGAGIICCLSYVQNKPCVIIANDPTVKGGTYFPLTVKKHIRAQEIALTNQLPCIYLVDSGGAFLPLQDEVFPDRFHFGRIFYNQAQLSGRGIAQLAVVLGSCTAGGAYVPAMSEQTIMTEKNACIFLGGPPLVKAATGEIVTPEELGGGQVHTNISGVADELAKNELDAFQKAREAVSYFDKNSKLLKPEQAPEEPLYDPTEVLGLMSTDLKKSCPALEIIARLVDGSRFREFKASYGASLKCGFAHIHGFRVGIIANDGILFSESALKAAHFIQICNKENTPLLFLQNIVGFMVGKKYEHKGIAKHGAKMVTAVATSRVPKISLIIGGSFGAGNYAMCGRAYDPRFLFSWPGSQISVMGGSQAAEVLTSIKFREQDEETERYRQEILDKYEKEGSAFYASARLWDDGIIDPRNTRKLLALALSFTHYEEKPYQAGIFRM